MALRNVARPARPADAGVRAARPWPWPLRFVAPPVAAYLLSHVLFLVAAARSGYPYFTTAAHQRWDSIFYQQIADHGYRLVVCNTDPTAYINTAAWCGNTGWFPLFGWLIRLCELLTGLSGQRSALLVAELATLAMLLLLWWLLTVVIPSATRPGADSDAPAWRWVRNLSLLALATLVPAGIYFDANFPMSLTVAATLACFGLTIRRRWVFAGLAGMAASTAYPVGLTAGLTAVVMIAILARRERPAWPRFLGPAALVGGLSAAGTGLVFVVMRVAVGRWDAFFLSQEKYGGQRGNALTTFLSIIQQGQYSPSVQHSRPGLVNRFHDTVRVEMAVSLGLVLLGCAAVAVALARRRFTALDGGLLVFAVVTFVVPLMAGTQISQYRSHTLLVPALLLVRRLPAWLLALLVAPAAVLGYKMATLFFSWLLF